MHIGKKPVCWWTYVFSQTCFALSYSTFHQHKEYFLQTYFTNIHFNFCLHQHTFFRNIVHSHHSSRCKSHQELFNLTVKKSEIFKTTNKIAKGEKALNNSVILSWNMVSIWLKCVSWYKKVHTLYYSSLLKYKVLKSFAALSSY